MNKEKGLKRNRVSKACIRCRSKKIKCDGDIPCGNCKLGSRECQYPSNNERKPRMSKPPTQRKNESMKDLESRLIRLESLITTLVTKVNNDASNSPAISINDSVADESYSSPTSQQEEAIEDNNLSSKQATVDCSEQYFGIHATFNIFSEESTKFIKEKLKPQDHNVCLPLENFPSICDMLLNHLTSIFTEPIFADSELKLNQIPFSGEFPENKAVTIYLLQYLKKISLLNFICELEMIQGWFDMYYNGSKKFLRSSELLIMNISISIALAMYSFDRHRGLDDSISSNLFTKQGQEILGKVNIKDLYEMQMYMLRNAVSYYHRVSVISAGIRTIQAILYLIVYIETYTLDCHIANFLVAVAIRFAQEIGLHRFESFKDLPREEGVFRRRIWWVCQSFDIEMCYRAGKPPIVNTEDVSTLTDKDEIAFIFENYQNNSVGNRFLNYIQALSFPPFYSTFNLRLSQIRARSYNELFSASVQHTPFEYLIASLQSLNNEMFSLAELMDPNIRPVFFNDPNFKSLSGTEDIVDFQLVYFTHLMVINKLPFKVRFSSYDENSTELAAFRNIILNSARTILHIVNGLDRPNLEPSWVSWVMFFPFSAFLNLLGNIIFRPNAPESFDDAELLFETSLKFFSYNCKYFSTITLDTILTSGSQRELICDILSRVLLKILVKIVETSTNIDLLANNQKVRDHLDNNANIYPEFLMKKNSYPFRRISHRFGVSDLKSSHNSFSGSSGSLSGDHTPGGGISGLPLKDSNNKYLLTSDINQRNTMRSPSFDRFYSTVDSPNNLENMVDSIFPDYSQNLSGINFTSLPNFFYDNNLGT